MHILLRTIMTLLLVFSLFACKAKQQEGTIEGSVLPQGTQATITALQDGRAIKSVPAAADGRFTLVLVPGSYRISAAASATPAQRAVDNVTVHAGELIFLPPIDLAVATGKAVLSGKVLCPQKGCEVILVQEGVERAAIHTDSEGRYEFKELPAGSYEVRARLAGHSEDIARVAVSGDQKVEQNARLFPVITLEGVDWAGGKIRATGIGLPPADGSNVTVRKAMAQRAALADAQRNLLKTIEQIRLDSARTVKDVMANASVTTRIQGFLQGYTVVSERELDNGKVEVILELPLNGPSGLSRVLNEQ